MSKFEGTDWDNIDQTINIGAIKGEYNAWKTHWNQGKNWGIVGGKTGDKPKPKSVLDTVLSHGDATYARDQASSTEGLGILLEALTEIFDGDTIEEEHEKALEDAIADMLELLKKDGGRWNPRNIPFKTVTEFIEGDDDEEPTITRTEVYGHYRTKEYNKYVAWAKKNKKNYKGQVASSEDIWWSEDKGKAQPPLWQAITGEGDGENGKNGILAIARRALKSVKKIKMGDGNQLAVFNNSKGPQQLAQIKSVQEKVIEVLQRPDIYPAGKARAPMKDRLNAAFSLESYAIRNKEEASLLSFGKGFDRISGIDKLRTIRLRFPASNIALNRTIKEVLTILGKDLKTYETPKVKDGIAKPGLVLKQKVEKYAETDWKNILGKKERCFKPDCPYAQYSGGAEVTTQQAKSCSKKEYSGCPGNKMMKSMEILGSKQKVKMGIRPLPKESKDKYVVSIRGKKGTMTGMDNKWHTLWEGSQGIQLFDNREDAYSFLKGIKWGLIDPLYIGSYLHGIIKNGGLDTVTSADTVYLYFIHIQGSEIPDPEDIWKKWWDNE